MIAINKSEKEAILERFPNVHIVRTMKQKSKRHRYYCEEARSVMKFLGELRGTTNNTNRREGGNHTHRKTER